MVGSRRLRALLVAVGLTVMIGALGVSGAAGVSGASGGVPSAVATAAPAQSTDIDDSSATRRVQLVAGGLAILGVGLIGLTVWFWRSTRPDPEPLAPLELMGTRRWRQADAIERRHLLDEVRAHLNDDAADAARLTVDAGTTGPPSSELAALATAPASPPPPPPAGTDSPKPAETPEASPLKPEAEGDASDESPRPVHGDPLVHARDSDG